MGGGGGFNPECGWGLRSWLSGGCRQRVPQDTEAPSSQRVTGAGFSGWTGLPRARGNGARPCQGMAKAGAPGVRGDTGIPTV